MIDVVDVVDVELERAQAAFLKGWMSGFRRDPVLTVSEWADRFRILSPESANEHGRWRTDRTPYLREIMDCLSANSPIRRVVFMKSAQVGGTECGLNWLGYIIHNSPAPTMIVYPTVEVAEDVSKDRITPMINTTPEIAERLRENRSRGSENTITEKKFRGGLLKLSGANSAASLRSKPMKNLFFDESDGYTNNADGEGDPVSLARGRTTTFTERLKELEVSTPGLTGGRIEKSFLAGDQRRYFVPCPYCRHMDHMRWSNLRWSPGPPEDAKLLCANCEILIEEKFKTQMLAGGEWRATAESRAGVRSYHINGLYSPLGWFKWSDMATEFEAAQKDPSLLRPFVNIRLGECFEDRNEAVKPETILARREVFPEQVPIRVGVLVAAVDVQGDRLEYAIKGYGEGEESWLIAASSVPGDPEQTETWLKLDEILREPWKHESGVDMRVECVAVDCGFKSDSVYRFTKPRADRFVFATKGGNTVGSPLVGKPTMNNPYRARLYTLCTDTGKETLAARLRIRKPETDRPAPGYVHIPDWVDEEYAAQLTSERAVRKFEPGKKPVRKWEQLRDRNEAWDLEVYCLAALRILFGPTPATSLAKRVARLQAAQQALSLEGGPPKEPPPEGPSPVPSAAPPPRPRPIQPRPGGWARGWRR